MMISYSEEIKRKLVHLSSFWMVAATLLIPQKPERCILFGVLLGITLVSEHDYAAGGRFLGKLYGKLFGKMLRKKIRPGQWIVSGGVPVLVSALVVNLFFAPYIAAVAMAILLAGDAAAALVGRKFGRHLIINGKTLEGTLAFITAAYLAAAVVLLSVKAAMIDYVLLLPVVAVGALAELFQNQLKLDDNLLIPLSSAVFFQLLTLLL